MKVGDVISIECTRCGDESHTVIELREKSCVCKCNACGNVVCPVRRTDR